MLSIGLDGLYLGGNPLDIEGFGGEIDAFMGEEQECHTLDSRSVVHYVPGIPHLGKSGLRIGAAVRHDTWWGRQCRSSTKSSAKRSATTTS